jgi:hypothetical protein
MFGYVTICKPELKMKDYYKYKGYYCGLCRTLKERYGYLGQVTLTYDMTFLIILLTSLYESKTEKMQHRCMVHPVKKQDMLRNEITEYVADMNIVLTYHHLQDDWKDERSIPGLAGSGLLKRDYKKISKKYPRQCGAIEESLKRLLQCEKEKEYNVDTVSRCFGELMAELFVFRRDRWEESLRKIGFFLGKYIYIMDAYDDLEKDLKKDNYNPLRAIYGKDNYEETCYGMLTMMIAEGTGEFEKLPCVLDIDILRNILYNGVWTKYDNIQKEKKEKEGKK